MLGLGAVRGRLSGLSVLPSSECIVSFNLGQLSNLGLFGTDDAVLCFCVQLRRYFPDFRRLISQIFISLYRSDIFEVLRSTCRFPLSLGKPL